MNEWCKWNTYSNHRSANWSWLRWIQFKKRLGNMHQSLRCWCLLAYTCANLAYMVHQVARFTHIPEQSHVLAKSNKYYVIWRITRIWAFLRPNVDFKLSCCVDSDFGALFRSENPEDPVCVKSRTGYLIKNCSFNYGGRIHRPISSYERSNPHLRNCERNILQGFQEAIDS